VKGSATRRLIPASLILAATLVAIPLPANADPPETVGDIAYNSLPACDDFDVSVTGTGSKARVHEAVNGVAITAGRGYTLTFTNAETGEELVIQPTGSVQKVTDNGDGTFTVQATGGNVLILFPSDTGGPSTIQYVGRVVYTVDEAGVFTVESTSGTSRDLCEELA
jgi:hypothetical protein